MSKLIVLAGTLGALAAFTLTTASPVLADMETNAVWNNLRPNLTPPFTGQSGKTGAKTWKKKSASSTDGTYKKHKK